MLRSQPYSAASWTTARAAHCPRACSLASLACRNIRVLVEKSARAEKYREKEKKRCICKIAIILEITYRCRSVQLRFFFAKATAAFRKEIMCCMNLHPKLASVLLNPIANIGRPKSGGGHEKEAAAATEFYRTSRQIFCSIT